MADTKPSSKNSRVLSILKRLGAEEPVMLDEDEQPEAPDSTLSPGEKRERAAFRRRYGAYTKPGPDIQTPPSVPVAPPRPGFTGY